MVWSACGQCVSARVSASNAQVGITMRHMATTSDTFRAELKAHTRSPERLHERVQRTIRPAPGGCWQWTGPLSHLGYGRFNIGTGKFPAHRITYELYIGPIPDGLEIDHLCRNRACVNPAHLEPVTRRVNMERSEHRNFRTKVDGVCQRGHSMADAYVSPGTGNRACRECLDLSYQRRKAKRREHARDCRARGVRIGRPAL